MVDIRIEISSTETPLVDSVRGMLSPHWLKLAAFISLHFDDSSEPAALDPPFNSSSTLDSLRYF